MDKQKKIEEMGNKSIPRLLAEYSSVTFCALLFSALYNIVDTLFVSRGVGDSAMGGVSVVFPFMILQGAFAQAVGGGAASIISRHLGKKEYENAGNITANAMLLFYTTTILISIVGLIFITPILKIMGAEGEIMPYAKDYFTIILLSNVFSTGFSSIIRAEGRMKYSLLIWLIPTAINIALDGLFIYALHMGVKGAALATAMCQFTSFCMSVLFFTRLSAQKFTKIKISIKRIFDIISAGVPVLIQMGSMSVIFLIINRILSQFSGAQGITVFAYVSKIITLAVVPINAVAQAVSPISGYNIGAGRQKRVKQTLITSVSFCEIYAVIAFLLSFIISDRLISFFTTDISIIESGGNALLILSPSLFFAPFTVVAGSYFLSAGKKLSASAVSLCIPLMLFCAIALLSNKFDINGIWISIPISCAIAGAITFLPAIISVKKIKEGS